MNCTEFSNLLDAFMDGALSEEEARRMREHAAACETCAALLALRNDCRTLEEEIEVPDGFSPSWRRMIQEESRMEEKSRKKTAWKGWLAAAAALVFIIGGTVISRDAMAPRTENRTKASEPSAADREYGAYNGIRAAGGAPILNSEALEYEFEDMEVPMEAAEEEWNDDSADQGKTEKIIRTASFSLRTTAYDEDMEKLQALTAEMGGRVEYMSSSGDALSGQTRSASLTLRIPSSRLDDFLTGAKGISSVTSMTEERQDISDSYYDTQSRLETQRTKLARLQALMTAAEDVSDLIEIESAIADTQYWIDVYTSRLKGYDSRVDYSTVTVSVREIRITESEEVTLGQRIAAGLESSLEDFQWFLEDMLIFLVSALPWLAGIGVVIGVIILIVKKRKKNKNKKGN